MRPTRYARLTLVSLAARARGERLAHFLHIGKNAGTALKHALGDPPVPGAYRVVMHTHGVRMIDLPRGDKFFFVVRDPLDRFVSAFQSRLREDAPRFRSPWTPAEARAFAQFTSPAELGLALAETGPRRDAAAEVMRSIEHVRTSYWDWFATPAAVRRRERDILWIGFTETLAQQLPDLAARLGMPALALPSGTEANQSPERGAASLPPAARDALTHWYRRDYEFLDLCRELATRIPAARD